MTIKQILSITVRLRACLLVALLATGSIPAFADGTINMTSPASGAGWTYANPTVTITAGGNYTITGSTTTNRIRVNPGITVNITLNGVSIDAKNISEPCAFEIGDNSNVNLILKGTNILSSGYDRAGLRTGGGSARLDITADSDVPSLTATSTQGGAGIGGSVNETGKNITISGGTVTASSSMMGAGIGGGYNASGENITINGGKVTATSGNLPWACGAGIGGGGSPSDIRNGKGKNITINGGTVIATGGSDDRDESGGAGIGGGGNGSGENITITGGMVTATAGAGGHPSDIGNGGSDTNGSNVRIYGGSVKASLIAPQPCAKDGTTPVYLNTLTVTWSTGTLISYCGATPFGAYDLNNVKPDAESKLYLYLPAGADGTVHCRLQGSNDVFGAMYTRKADHTNIATLTKVTPVYYSAKVKPKAYDGTTDAEITDFTITPEGLNLNLNTDYIIAPLKFSDAIPGSSKPVKLSVTLKKTAKTTGLVLNVPEGVDIYGTINKKGITVTGGTVTPKDYDGNTSATATGLTFTGPLATLVHNTDYTFGTASFIDANAGTGKNVRVNSIVLKGTAATNYSLDGLSGGGCTLDGAGTINRIDLVAATHLDFDLASKNYTGSPQGITAPKLKSAYTGMGTNLKVSYKGVSPTDYPESETVPTDAGTYEVKISTGDNGTNFKVASGLSLGNYTINRIDPKKEDLTCSPPSTIPYDGQPHPVTVTDGTATGGLGTITVKYNSSTNDPVNVNTYTVTVDVAQSTNYNGATLDLGKFEIVRADPKLTDLDLSQLPSSTITYDGQPHPVTVTDGTATGGLGTITVKYDDSENAPKNAGSYSLSVDITQSANYNTFSLPLNKSLTIDRKKITVTGGTVTARAYNGTTGATVENLTFAGVLTGESPLSLTADYTFGAATFADPDAGPGKDVTVNSITLENDAAINYSITNLGSNESYTLTGAINKARPEKGDLNFADPIPSVTYNGKPQEFSVTESTAGIGSITVKYGDDMDAPASAGTCLITVEIGMSTNYETATLTLGNYTIDKKDITVTGDGVVTAKDYDGDASATVKSLIFAGLENGEILVLDADFTIGDATFNDKNAATDKTVTVPDITLNGPGTKGANYNLTGTSTATLTTGVINQRKLLLTGGQVKTKEYDGITDAEIESLDFNGLQSGETFDLDDDYAVTSATFESKDVDNGIKVTATGVSLVANPKTDNYRLDNGTGYDDLAGDITPRKINITGGTATKIYDGKKDAEVSSLTFDYLLANTEDLDDDCTVANATFAGAEVNTGIMVTADVTLKSTPKAGNYELLNGTACNLLKGEITPATPTAKELAFDLTTIVYDASAHPVTVTAKSGIIGLGTAFTVYYDGSSTAVPTAAKTYAVTVDISAGTNYTAIANLSLGNYTIAAAMPPVAAFDFDTDTVTYNGKPHPVTVTVKTGINGMGKITATKYDGSTTPPTAAGRYAVTVDIAAGDHYTAIANLLLDSLVIAKALPTVAELEFTLSNTTCDGVPFAVPVTPAKGIAGLGEITVRYNGSTIPPVDPGVYIVTIDIAEGANYTVVTGLQAGMFTIFDPPAPAIRRRVTLLPTPGLTTDPAAGPYYINSGSNFTFRLTPDVPSPDGAPPQVRTSRAPATDGSTGIRITPNADGSYTVVILAIRQDIEITLSTATDNASVVAGALEVFTAPGALVIANSRPDAAIIYVYNLAGTLVRLTTVPPGTTRLPVMPGIYVVTDGGAFRRKTAVVR